MPNAELWCKMLKPGVFAHAFNHPRADRNICLHVEADVNLDALFLVDLKTGRREMLFDGQELRDQKFKDLSEFRRRLWKFTVPRAPWKDWTKAEFARLKKPRKRKAVKR
jgi:hypothetical protein